MIRNDFFNLNIEKKIECSKMPDVLCLILLFFSYKLVAEYSDSLKEDASFYVNAIFNGQSSVTKTKSNNEDFLLYLMRNQKPSNQTKTLLGYQTCNKRYPCSKEVWQITELVRKIFEMPTWVWKRTMGYNNDDAHSTYYYWLRKYS